MRTEVLFISSSAGASRAESRQAISGRLIAIPRLSRSVTFAKLTTSQTQTSSRLLGLAAVPRTCLRSPPRPFRCGCVLAVPTALTALFEKPRLTYSRARLKILHAGILFSGCLCSEPANRSVQQKIPPKSNKDGKPHSMAIPKLNSFSRFISLRNLFVLIFNPPPVHIRKRGIPFTRQIGNPVSCQRTLNRVWQNDIPNQFQKSAHRQQPFQNLVRRQLHLRLYRHVVLATILLNVAFGTRRYKTAIPFVVP